MAYLVSFSRPHDNHLRNGPQVIHDEQDKCLSREDEPVPTTVEVDDVFETQRFNPLEGAQEAHSEGDEPSLEERINAILPFPQPPENPIEANVMGTILSEYDLSLVDISGYSESGTPSLEEFLGPTPDYPSLPQ